MRNYLPLAVILLAPAVSAWNACYCAGVKARADEAARSCCTAGDGVGFPKTNSDVLGRWDQTEQVCRFAGSVLTQNTLAEAQGAFGACCTTLHANNKVTGGVCTTK
ncbi:hypothetical protein TUN199_11828 [Pyrenophora tritici-repentis]|nr:hypothetical protein TUN205_11404 [Pyrenophora tritici-repentis]KAI0616183.1 hypothetical protein TUN199_11828 [Pyrenophora tritici-repentis]